MRRGPPMLRRCFLQLVSSLLYVIVGNAIITEAIGTSPIVDLSKDWEKNSTYYNSNRLYCTLQASVDRDAVFGYVIVKNGLLMAEGYGSGITSADIKHIWSVTKNWASMVVGKAVERGKLSVDDTLDDIFTNPAYWENVQFAAQKKTVTVRELLTMTSGLDEPMLNDDQAFDSHQDFLDWCTYNGDERGYVEYLNTYPSLSWIVREATGRDMNRYAKNQGIFSKLGMVDGVDYEWKRFGDGTDAGISGSAFGLHMNARQLAKLGQLYLQNGLSAPGEQLIQQSWINESLTDYLMPGDRERGYGYRWILFGDEYEYPRIEALGRYSQSIVIIPSENVVIGTLRKDDGCGSTARQVDQGSAFRHLILDNLRQLERKLDNCDSVETAGDSGWFPSIQDIPLPFPAWFLQRLFPGDDDESLEGGIEHW